MIRSLSGLALLLYMYSSSKVETIDELSYV
jgi:hypothetical protein